MIVEGAEPKAPSPILCKPTPEQIEVATRVGQQRAKKYQRRTDQWGAGTLVDANEIGLLGEIVFADWMNEQLGKSMFRVNLDILECGDGGVDFNIRMPWGDPDRIDVKTSRRDVLMVPRMRQGRIQEIKSNVFIAAQLTPERNIRLLGFAYARDLEDCNRSRVFTDMHNLIAKPHQFRNMGRLVTRYKGVLQ